MFRPDCCKIFRKKGYYSRDREDFIIFDISVEVFMPGFETPSLLAHKLGHHLLNHKRYMTREAIRAQEIDQSELITIPKGEVERLEWQANTFASCLLMPKEEFQTAFGLLMQHFGIRNRGHGPLYLDSQRDNVTQFHAVCSAMSKYFNVSKTAIRLRMRALALLVEVGRLD